MKRTLIAFALLALVIPAKAEQTVDKVWNLSKGRSLVAAQNVPEDSRYRVWGSVGVKWLPSDFLSDNDPAPTLSCALSTGDGKVVQLGGTVYHEDMSSMDLPPQYEATLEYEVVTDIDRYWIMYCYNDIPHGKLLVDDFFLSLFEQEDK